MNPSKIKNKIVLVQPTLGISGEFVCHIPLSLLYVASGLVKSGFEVTILDNRRYSREWRNKLAECLGPGVLFVGITVMSGSPVANAIEVSKFVKSKGNIPVVWGGAHPTVMPGQILENDFVDFTVSGSGVCSTVRLAGVLGGPGPHDSALRDIQGLGFRAAGRITVNPPFQGFEHVPHTDLPYFLIEDPASYSQIGSSERIFPIYSAYGCPYQCAFCVSPRMYRGFKNKWDILPAAEVADHIAYLIDKYGATEIYFYDDDSFVQIDHVRRVMEEIQRRKLKVRMSFRGARVNEIMKMDDAYLNALADAGTHILHVGIESGSQRILDLFKKGIKVQDIIDINRKLARNKRIIAGYNWILGTPTETLEDIALTRKLILQLIAENPRCFIFQPNKFRPLPGTELAELAVQYGYKTPARLEDWINDEVEGDKSQPWYSKPVEKMIKMLQVTAYFIDRKPELLLESRSLANDLIKMASMLYKPVAKARFKYGLTGALLEYPLFQYLVSRYRN